MQTLGKIERVKAMLVQWGKTWRHGDIQQSIEYLQGVEETGRTTTSMYNHNHMSEIEVVIKEEIRDFI